MKTVHQHPEGLVYVRVGDVVYGDTRENCETDFGVKLPPLPPDASERIYEQGERHAVQGQEGVVYGGEMPWPLGDDLIARVEAGLAAQNARKVAGRA